MFIYTIRVRASLEAWSNSKVHPSLFLYLVSPGLEDGESLLGREGMGVIQK